LNFTVSIFQLEDDASKWTQNIEKTFKQRLQRFDIVPFVHAAEACGIGLTARLWLSCAFISRSTFMLTTSSQGLL
jgi:hypothetical protein